MATDVESMLDYLVANLGIDRERIRILSGGERVSIQGEARWTDTGLQSDDGDFCFHEYLSASLRAYMRRVRDIDISVSVNTGCGTDNVADPSSSCVKCGASVKRQVQESKSGDRLTRLCCTNILCRSEYKMFEPARDRQPMVRGWQPREPVDEITGRVRVKDGRLEYSTDGDVWIVPSTVAADGTCRVRLATFDGPGPAPRHDLYRHQPHDTSEVGPVGDQWEDAPVHGTAYVRAGAQKCRLCLWHHPPGYVCCAGTAEENAAWKERASAEWQRRVYVHLSGSLTCSKQCDRCEDATCGVRLATFDGSGPAPRHDLYRRLGERLRPYKITLYDACEVGGGYWELVAVQEGCFKTGAEWRVKYHCGWSPASMVSDNELNGMVKAVLASASAPQGTEDLPQGTEDLPQGTEDLPQGTEDLPHHLRHLVRLKPLLDSARQCIITRLANSDIKVRSVRLGGRDDMCWEVETATGMALSVSVDGNACSDKTVGKVHDHVASALRKVTYNPPMDVPPICNTCTERHAPRVSCRVASSWLPGGWERFVRNDWHRRTDSHFRGALKCCESHGKDHVEACAKCQEDDCNMRLRSYDGG